MNAWDYFAVISLPLAIIVNTLSVYLQRKHLIYARFKRHGWIVHRLIIGVFWIVPIIGGFGLRYSRRELAHPYIAVGLIIMASAIALFTAAIRQVGWQALGNGNFFGQKVRKLKGIYRYLHDPIYISYSLWYVGLTLVTAKKTFGLMALIMALGLLLVESPVEDIVS